ncbi:MAG: hypothetical protein KAG64_04135 [Bacteroidales bacterium]|nr:hypothetical protein [Bacteroidales bacterium]
MKKNSKLSFFIFILILFAVSCSNETSISKESNGEYTKITKEKGKLAKDSMIQGFPCKSSWVHYYSNGNISQFELAKEFTIAGISFSKKTIVFLDSNGVLSQVYLPKDQIIQSYQCTGGNMKSATGFYPSGKLHFFFPHDNVLIDGVLCKGGAMSGIWLYESGKLKKAYAATKLKLNEKVYKKGSLIEL